MFYIPQLEKSKFRTFLLSINSISVQINYHFSHKGAREIRNFVLQRSCSQMTYSLWSFRQVYYQCFRRVNGGVEFIFLLFLCFFLLFLAWHVFRHVLGMALEAQFGTAFGNFYLGENIQQIKCYTFINWISFFFGQFPTLSWMSWSFFRQVSAKALSPSWRNDSKQVLASSKRSNPKNAFPFSSMVLWHLRFNESADSQSKIASSCFFIAFRHLARFVQSALDPIFKFMASEKHFSASSNFFFRKTAFPLSFNSFHWFFKWFVYTVTLM